MVLAVLLGRWAEGNDFSVGAQRAAQQKVAQPEAQGRSVRIPPVDSQPTSVAEVAPDEFTRSVL
jgi:hypothetical protein